MIYLLTGGSACGKSTYAEKLAASFSGVRYYIATMRPYGIDGQERVLRHHKQRQGLGFETIEHYTGVGALVLPSRGTVLLECLCNLTANELFDADGAGKDAERAVVEGIASLEKQCNNLIVVTNDVSSDGCQYAPEVLHYIEVLGKINNTLAERFDNVYELCCGIPLLVKGTLPCM